MQGGPRAAARVKYYPEIALDDFSRVDSAVEFYLRVNSLLHKDMVVVDLGAGRGQWYVDGLSETRRRLRDIRGTVRQVIGLDVDPVVAENPALDVAHVIAPGARWPLEDNSVDLVVCDYTLEHIDDPDHLRRELDRVLRPGGWLCARTPNKWGYIGIGGRLVPNRWHVTWLRRLQPGRKDIDVFPTRYRLNTRRDLRLHFPDAGWERIVYTMPGEPGYSGASPRMWSAIGVLHRFQPRWLEPVLLIFIRKRG